MTETTFRTILFIALLLLAPVILFLVQVVFIVPPVVLLAGAGYLLQKIAGGGFSLDNLTFLIFLLLHLVFFGGIYWLLSWILGKLARLLPRGAPRIALLGVLLAALAGLSQLPIYGGTGHGSAHLGPLQSLLADLERSYGTGSSLGIYIAAAVLVVAVVGWRLRRQHG